MWKDIEIYDFHSHILPAMDDGAKDIKMSLEMLGYLTNQGVDKVLATSHYYNFNQSVEEFLIKRDESVFKLQTYIKEHDIFTPDIITACEVRLFPDMHKEEKLDRLCIEGTNKILVEMPYIHWNAWMYNEIYALISKGYEPIVAHIERYASLMGAKEIIEKLIRLNVRVQINSEFIKTRKERKLVKKLIKLKVPMVLGTDCHNLEDRKGNIKESLEYLSKKYSDEFIKEIMQNAKDFTN